MSQLVMFNSKDRVAGLNYQPIFGLPQLTNASLLRYNVALESIEFANCVYPINSTRQNNIIYFQENNDTGTTYEATLTAKSYTGSTFATEVQTQLNNSTGNAYTYTVSYDSASKKLTISEATNSPFRFVTGVNSAHRETGWDLDTQTAFVTSSTELGQSINVAGTLYVDIISTLQTPNTSTSTTGNVLLRVPMNAAYGEIVYHRDLSGHSSMLYSDTMANVEFRMIDDRGYAYDLPDHFPISLVLRLSTD